jgi:cell fate (sporulation/competence/biofilm development) regulator YmcA (YheA/YmcA/DUF963 family)
MTYKEIKSKNQADNFLYKLNLISAKKVEFELNLYPDYDSIEYDKYRHKEYVFFQKEYFNEEYNSVLKCHISDYGFKSDNQEENELINEEGNDLVKVISSNFNEKINKFELQSIDNINKTLNFYGAFFGDSFIMDISIFSEFKSVAICLIEYIPKDIIEKDFYYQILAESRLLLEEGKINLAFFTAFSSIDLYINYWEEYHQLAINKKRRLKEKLKDIFKNALNIQNLGKHQIWSSLIAEFNKLELWRNDIAHGRQIELNKNNYNELIIVIVSFIFAMEHNLHTFEEIDNFLNTIR